MATKAKIPKEGDTFRVDGVRHEVVRVAKNIRGVEQVDCKPTDPTQAPHDLISFHAAEAVWDAEWDYWYVPGRENTRARGGVVIADGEG